VLDTSETHSVVGHFVEVQNVFPLEWSRSSLERIEVWRSPGLLAWGDRLAAQPLFVQMPRLVERRSPAVTISGFVTQDECRETARHESLPDMMIESVGWLVVANQELSLS
jgi:hypothetical protein